MKELFGYLRMGGYVIQEGMFCSGKYIKCAILSKLDHQDPKLCRPGGLI